jgi:tetratricopeptide (TPR) repeat protein
MREDDQLPERLPRKAAADRTGAADAAFGGYANTGIHIGSVYSYPQQPTRSRYREQVRQIAPPELVSRDDELAELRAFCTAPNENESYAWWRATKWAGKSALMAWFVLHPPAGVRIVSFFVTARLAGQDHRGAFVDVLLEQLAELLDEPLPTFLPAVTREHHLVGMFAETAELCARRGERLVLVVDGLDEDRGTVIADRSHSIAALLPAKPPAGMRVIVAGRPNPPVPPDVRRDHPLRNPGIIRPLTVSPAARVIRDDMELELDRLLNGTTTERHLLGLLTAAGGGLSGADLAALTESTPGAVRRYLRTVAGRSFETRPSHWQLDNGPDVYLLGHEELQATATEELGESRLAEYRERLHLWAENYRRQRWPSTTPEYLLRGYFRMLAANGDLSRMVACATDRARQDLLLQLSGGDLDALGELATGQEVILNQENPDIAAMTRLAVHRDRLIERSGDIPAELPALWALLGHIPRAEALLDTIANIESRRAATVLYAQVLAGRGDLDRVRHIAHSTMFSDHWSETLICLIEPLVRRGEIDAAEEIVRAMPSDRWVVEARVSLATALADRGDMVAHELLRDARRLTDSIGEPHAHMAALRRLTRGLVETGDLRSVSDLRQSVPRVHHRVAVDTSLIEAANAKRRFGLATALARRSTGADLRAHRLASTAQAVAIAGHRKRAQSLIAEAEATIEKPTEDEVHQDTTSAIAAALATTGDFTQAEVLIDSLGSQSDRDAALAAAAAAAAAAGELHRAEAMVGSISGKAEQAGARVALATVYAEAGHSDRARELAVQVEETNRAEVAVRSHVRARQLTSVARALEEAGDLPRAYDLAHRARQLVDSFADREQHGSAVTSLASCMAQIGIVNDAVKLLGSVIDPKKRVDILLGLDQPQLIHDHLEQIRTWIAEIDQVDARTAAMVSVAEQLATGDDNAALLLTGGIGDENRKMEMLATLVRRLNDVGANPRAEKILQLISHPYWLTEALIHLVTSTAPDEVLAFIDRWSHSLEKISCMDWRVRVATAFTKALMSTGEQARVTSFIEQTHAWIERITSPYGQVRALILLAQTTSSPRLVARSRDLARRAAAIAEWIPQLNRHAELLTSLVEVLVSRGELSRAETLAKNIQQPDRQAEVLAALATALVRQQEFDRAEALTEVIQHPDQQAKVLAILVWGLAEQDVGRASRAADKIAKPIYHAEALASLAESNIASREKRLASIEQARQLLRSIPSRSNRQNILRRLIGALLVMGEHDRAETLSRSIAHPEDQATAWSVLAQHHSTAKTGRPTARILHLRNWERALDILVSTHPATLDIVTDEVLAD